MTMSRAVIAIRTKVTIALVPSSRCAPQCFAAFHTRCDLSQLQFPLEFLQYELIKNNLQLTFGFDRGHSLGIRPSVLDICLAAQPGTHRYWTPAQCTPSASPRTRSAPSHSFRRAVASAPPARRPLRGCEGARSLRRPARTHFSSAQSPAPWRPQPPHRCQRSPCPQPREQANWEPPTSAVRPSASGRSMIVP